MVQLFPRQREKDLTNTKPTKTMATTTTPRQIINRTADASREDYLGDIRTAIHRASRRRINSKLFFDFGEEGSFEAGRKTNKAEAAIYDMATSLKLHNCETVEVFRNMLGGVTIKSN